MMSALTRVLKDDNARWQAISQHGRSFLVEAGAGSGKTAVMAGRIALMLADGIRPSNIAAVTFTELAASELLVRVRNFVSELCSSVISAELRVALPNGLSEAQLENLHTARAAIDEMTCSTIHGFCQRLIKPYPVEANLDPGAVVMDAQAAERTFNGIVDDWLRETLNTNRSSVIAEMVMHSPDETLTLIHLVADKLRQHRGVSAPAAAPIQLAQIALQRAAANFVAFTSSTSAHEPESVIKASQLAELAAELSAGASLETSTGTVRALALRPHQELCTQAGDFKAYKFKGKWETAAKLAGLSKAEGAQLNDQAQAHYEACRQAWTEVQQSAAAQALAAVIEETQQAVDKYGEYKRSTARLDYDDLIYTARDLLRDHPEVCSALGQRFVHVLVDEFQDTDQLQAEIFWRLCGTPSSTPDDWTTFQIRPGALFLVGDPKQAIYRFRGADVSAYVQAREAFKEQAPDSLLTISTNFRSCSSILTYVNERFQGILSSPGQPGFTALEAFHGERETPCVAALNIAAAGADGKSSSEQQRDAEAEAVADLCARLIGSQPVADRHGTSTRPCQPGDIALLAPTGTDLWRYEQALEQRGIPVATQAGKGLYRRQEIQDLIALTRVLADRRDTLALGSLLRGPLVGLSEEELLDVVWALPRNADTPERLPSLDLSTGSADVTHPLAREIIEKLQSLNRRANSTTPHALLSQAVDMLQVRPLLLQRHGAQAERALANIDLYLSFSTTYAGAGLRAFSEAMTAAWEDETRAVEGRPDAQEEAVALVTMHAAKGLEWPIVIPINTMTQIMSASGAIVDRHSDTLYCKVLKIAPAGYEAAMDKEKEELERERIRLWYVAATRARELLVLTRHDTVPSKSAWASLLDLDLANLPEPHLADWPAHAVVTNGLDSNYQTRERFAREAEAIAASQPQLCWLAPSRNEGTGGAVLEEETIEIWTGTFDDQTHDLETSPQVQGGRERGLILHKLMEEVLTGETDAQLVSLIDRARELILALEQTPVADPATGLAAEELASCVTRTLELPEVAALRKFLLPEFVIYSAKAEDGQETATVGIADALTFTESGLPDVVVDWKSDVDPAPGALKHYQEQVQTYLDITHAMRGMIVFMSTGRVVEVRPTKALVDSIL